MRRVFGTKRGLFFKRFGSTAAAPTLIPAGHFSNVTAPTVASLPDLTVSSLNTSLAGTRANPDKYKTLTMNSGTLASVSRGAVYLWLDKLVMNTATIHANGQNANDGISCPCGGPAFGGGGGYGGSGGGGGAASTDLNANGGAGGSASNSNSSGAIGEISGDVCVTTGGAGGVGFAKNGGTGYLDSASPFAYLLGGSGGDDSQSDPCDPCVPTGSPGGAGFLGAGGGGAGGFVVGGIAANGGGGGGANALTVVMRELTIAAATVGRFSALGGNCGNPSVCAVYAGGGGGGSVQLFIAKVTSAVLARLQASVTGGAGGSCGSGDGSAGNFAIYEINTSGTILNTYSNTVPVSGWDHT